MVRDAYRYQFASNLALHGASPWRESVHASVIAAPAMTAPTLTNNQGDGRWAT